MEIGICIDQSATWHKCIGSNGLNLALQASDALGYGITGTITAWMSFGLKAEKVGLHCIDTFAHRCVSTLVDFTTCTIICVDKIDTSYTARILTCQVHIVFNASTQEIWLEDRSIIK